MDAALIYLYRGKYLLTVLWFYGTQRRLSRRLSSF